MGDGKNLIWKFNLPITPDGEILFASLSVVTFISFAEVHSCSILSTRVSPSHSIPSYTLALGFLGF